MLDKNIRWLEKLVKKAGSVLGRGLDSLNVVVKRHTANRLSWTMSAILSSTPWQHRGAAAADNLSHCAVGLSNAGDPLFPQPPGYNTSVEGISSPLNFSAI